MATLVGLKPQTEREEVTCVAMAFRATDVAPIIREILLTCWTNSIPEGWRGKEYALLGR
jgi:hypothetical protein